MTNLISLTMKELSRYEVLRKLIRKELNGSEAAAQLSLSTRQVRNLKARLQRYGPHGLIHGNRGKQGNRRIPQETIAAAQQYLKTHYADFKPTFACEKLRERHGIILSHEKVRELMTGAGLWKPKSRRTNGQYRSWRPRREVYGEMQQFDGSYERWFEDRAPSCCLIAAIDDATGKITGARFVSDEGVLPVFGFWKDYLLVRGKPTSIYLDKYSTYKVNAKTLLDDPAALTQFERAMKELGIAVIHAHSPQAKGRIERLFGTLQDRLVKELRLAGIAAIAEANQFLTDVFIPRFNVQFGVAAQQRRNLHRKLTAPEKTHLDAVLSIREARQVQNDFTVQYGGTWFQLAETQPTLVCRKDRVQIEKRIGGSVHVSLRGKYLVYAALLARPEKIRMKQITALSRNRTPWKPPPDHPWRKAFTVMKNTNQQEIVTVK